RSSLASRRLDYARLGRRCGCRSRLPPAAPAATLSVSPRTGLRPACSPRARFGCGVPAPRERGLAPGLSLTFVDGGGDSRPMRLPDATEGERRRIASAPAFTVLLVAFVLHFTLGSQVQRANLPTGIAYGQILFFFAIPWMTVVALGLGPRSFLALAWPRARPWPWILLASAAGFCLAGGLNSLNQWLVGPEVARFFDSTRILRDRPFAEQLAIALGVTLLAPLGEEVLFRGYFLRVLRARYGTVSALLLTSAVFAAMHLNPASFLA